MTSQALTLSLQSLQWRAYRLLDQLGLVGKFSLLVTLLGLAIFLLKWLPLQQDLRALAAQQAAEKIAQQHPTKTQSPQAVLDSYLAQFPAVTQKNQTLNAWMQIAEARGLVPDSVTYQSVQTEKNAVFKPTLVNFSLYAPYVEIQQFLNQVMTQMPYVAIERLQLNKEEAEEDAIAAHIRLKFYFSESGRVSHE